jgi:hypothetical protein
MGESASKPLEWEELPKEKKESIRDFYTELNKLIEFGNKANENVFIFLFEERLGKHLWYKFREMKDLFLFLNYLDVKNREIILTNIYGHKDSFSPNPLYANCY